MLTDGDSLTPGPWTYHQFWFRDAAIMLRALDVAGYHNAVRRVILTFPSRQEHTGYFRSQQGEWDSNGQALWTVWQHAVIANDRETPAQLFDSLQDGAAWIRKKRLKGSQHAGKPYEGLLPPGLSAEHLGLADYYFWDNWWSVAGLEAFARLCRTLGKASEEENVIPLLNGYRADIERAIAYVQSEKGIREIPAGPTRGIDCGMIGSCAAWYPLQELSPADPRMRQTLTTLEERYFIDGLFFQHFIHSGKNPYLTLQMAHAWLYSGERERFWNMVSDVARHASSTLNYPEAIHPRTGGGAMGDGHHGWAAAEIVLALRDAFVYELWPTSSARGSLVLLGGLPRGWFSSGSRCEMTNAPVPGGRMSITTEAHPGRVQVDIAFQFSGDVQAGAWTLKAPLAPSTVTVNGAAAISFRVTEQGVEVALLPGLERTQVLFELDT
jgi:hypothetical protein